MPKLHINSPVLLTEAIFMNIACTNARADLLRRLSNLQYSVFVFIFDFFKFLIGQLTVLICNAMVKL